MLAPVFTVYQDERFVFFSGPHGDNGYLSNWYETHFSLDSRDFENSEQAFLYLKALRSGDEATAMRVFAMSDPKYFARLSRQIRPFDARQWAGRRESVMRQVVHEKFLQSEELCDSLLATEEATIVSCSGSVLWSCGLGMEDPRRLEPAHWVGQNLLGTILMELREELRPPKLEPEETPAEAVAQDGTPSEGASEPTSPEADSALTQPLPMTEAEVAPDTAPDNPADTGATTPVEDAQPATAEAAAATADASELPAEPVVQPETSPMTDTEVTARQAPAAPASEASEDSEPHDTASEAESTSELPAISGNAPTAVEAPATDSASQETPEAGSEDAIVSRYEEGTFPTAAELSDGSVLKHLMRMFSQEDSPEVRRALMQCLRDSTVIVPANKVDPLIAATAPVREDGKSDPLIMDSGKTYRPNVLENTQGDRWFPAFSSEAEVDEQVRGRATLLTLPMAQCVELARTHGGLAGIVVNVFSENLILPGKTCDYIANLPKGTEA